MLTETANLLASAALPLLLLILPGVLVSRSWPKIILASISFNILATLLFTLLHIPLIYYLPLLLLFSFLAFFGKRYIHRNPVPGSPPGQPVAEVRKEIHSSLSRRDNEELAPTERAWLDGGLPGAGPLFFFVLIYIFFSLAFTFRQNALPTGDSQKAVFWAQKIIQTNSFPDYQSAVTLLNRDPVDFYTPGLHSLTAATLAAAPNDLAATGFLSLALAIACAFIAAAIARQVWPRLNPAAVAAVTILLILTHLRFLRYIAQPGYHLQNILGELLLFGVFYTIFQLWKKWDHRTAVLMILLSISLFFSHQFSSFIAVFSLLPAAALLLLRLRRRVLSSAKSISVFAATLLLFITTALLLNLQEKIPHLFNTQPHLLSLAPHFSDYPRLLGLVWLALSLGGLALLLRTALRRHSLSVANLPFLLAALVLLALSQAPRFYLDIPPVRALLYFVIPGSIAAAGFILSFYRNKRSYLFIALMTVTLIAVFAGLHSAFTAPSAIRTDSTLLPSQLEILQYLQTEDEGAVLYDDYNRRSSSWLILSGRPAFARLGAEMSRQMQEAWQSPLRYQMYLNQLDFEKIYALGSFPETSYLLAKHNIRYVTGISGSTESSFAHNPLLNTVASANGHRLLAAAPARPASSRLSPDNTRWLLKTSTLANDIGDLEDTYEHTPASLRAARLSDPFFENNSTWRTTTAPVIPLKFNVDDFVRYLWDKESTGSPDTALDALITYSSPEHNLTLQTSTGQRYPLLNANRVRIQPEDAPIEEDGFITLYLINPKERPVSIDLIALGPSSVP